MTNEHPAESGAEMEARLASVATAPRTDEPNFPTPDLASLATANTVETASATEPLEPVAEAEPAAEEPATEAAVEQSDDAPEAVPSV